MTILYKLTDQNWETHGLTKWGPGVTHETNGEGDLCGPGWLHAYTHPLLAVFLNPIHGDFSAPVLWRCEGLIGETEHGLKVGCARLTTIEVLPLPVVTTEQRIRFAIFCALEVCQEKKFVVWAKAWLSGQDRSAEAAAKAEAADWVAANADWVAAKAAADAAKVAVMRENKLDLIALAHRAMEDQ